jgi:hypothetical protein
MTGTGRRIELPVRERKCHVVDEERREQPPSTGGKEDL